MSKVFQLDQLEVPDLGKATDKLIKLVMPEVTHTVAEAARELVPVRTGKLQRSIVEVVDQRGMRGRVIAKARHAHLIHDGTVGHTVGARRKKSLRFVEGGQFVFFKEVWVKGVEADPFLDRALEQSEDDVQEILRTGGQAALEEVASGV